jgi:hypothetical protein
MDVGGRDWQRWEEKGWEPAKLMRRVEQLNAAGLVIETEWGLDRQKNWREAFEEAKADLARINDKIERERAEKALAFAKTRLEVIRHLKRIPPIWPEPVEFYAAYQSKKDFEEMHPVEDAVKDGVQRANFLIKHQLAIPDEDPEQLVTSVLKLVTTQAFRKRRRSFYDWQIETLKKFERLEGKLKAHYLLHELEECVRDFNAAACANHGTYRQETVITVLAVAGILSSGFADFNPELVDAVTQIPGAAPYVEFAGQANAAGLAIWGWRLGGKEADAPHSIAAPGAMFHQIETETGFEFRVSKPR